MVLFVRPNHQTYTIQISLVSGGVAIEPGPLKPQHAWGVKWPLKNYIKKDRNHSDQTVGDLYWFHQYAFGVDIARLNGVRKH